MSDHTAHYKGGALILRYNLEVRRRGPDVGIHPFLIPEQFHNQSRILSLRQKTESDKNTKTHSRTIVQTLDTQRLLLEMLPVLNKDIGLWEKHICDSTWSLNIQTDTSLNIRST
jgi:hypothetical protein